MKTCLLIPVYNSAGTLPRLFRYLRRLDPKPDMTFFAENNSTDATLWLIRKHYRNEPHRIIRVWFRGDAVDACSSVYEPIAHVRQLLLTAARRFDPDYAIFLDSDVYPLSPNLIAILTGWQKDIVGGSYVRLFSDGPYLASKFPVEGRPDLYRYYTVPFAPLMEPIITSAGCLCLSRRVLRDKRLNFWPMYEGDKRASEDFGFCLRARELGYKIYLDGTAVLWHDLSHVAHVKPWSRSGPNMPYVKFRYG